MSETVLSRTSVVVESEMRFVGINGRFDPPSTSRNNLAGDRALARAEKHFPATRRERLWWTDEDDMIENDFPSVRPPVL